MTVRIYAGDCLDALRQMPDASVDAVVTDPPYGLAFMGKKWDYDVPPVEVWAECLRVLKPGGHLLAFAGTRTQHRMAVRIEDAGFEIRDMIAWVYASGYPKSLNVSKAIAANTDAARQWEGWGTALKPALEPITVARKPLIGTVAENVLTHGTGAINVDGCRVGDEARWNPPVGELTGIGSSRASPKGEGRRVTGRWPANLIHDGSDEVVAGFPVTANGSRKAGRHVIAGGQGRYGMFGEGELPEIAGDTGSAARFFYCAKASKADRDEGCEGNNHMTVKPTALMRYLVRLVTPPGGVVLDPYMGSGSTGKAAVMEGFSFIGCERDADYLAIARARISSTPAQGRLL